MEESGQQSPRDWLIGAATASVLVILGVAVPVLVSQVLPSAATFGAGMPARMVRPVIVSSGMATVGLAVVVGVLWAALNRWAWGRAATTVIVILGVAFMHFFSWNSCLIPHEHCSAIP